MKHIYHLLLVLMLLAFVRQQSHAQINCSIGVVQDTMILPGPILATAMDTSQIPIVVRRWTLSTCSGTIVQSTPLGLNANYSYVPTQPGCYCLRLWTANQVGDTCISNYCNIFIVDTPKVTSWSVTPSQFCAPQVVTLSMQTSAGCGFIDSTRINWGCGNVSILAGSPSTVTHLYSTNCNTQCYDINILLKNSCGAYGNKKLPGAVCLSDIHAYFTASTTSASCVNNLTSHLIADSAGPGATYCWYVNNVQAQCSNSRTFTRTYNASANCYTIKLIVSKPTGCVDSMVRQNYICVTGPPQLAYTTPVSEICIDSGNSYLFCLYNSSLPLHPSPKWKITGPQGFTYGPVTGDTICFNANRFGNYTITMMGDYGVNCKDTVVFASALRLKQNPVPCFYANDTLSCLSPFTVNFTNCSTSPPGSTCTWNWGSNTLPSTSTLCGPQWITYNGFGSSSVSLTITTPQGCTKTLLKPNYIKRDSLRPSFTVAYHQGCVPLFATLVSTTVSTIPIGGYYWEVFSQNGNLEGTGQSGAYPHQYTQPGIYTARLTVTSGNCSSTIYKDSAVLAASPPVCSLVANPTNTCASTPVTFNLTGSNCSYDTLWVHYGDEALAGTASLNFGIPFSHQYAPGEYDAWIVPSLFTCKGDTLRTHITVLGAIADFTSAANCLGGDTVFFQNTSQGANRYHWQFNCAADTFNTASPKLLLPHCDTCRVSLTAYNDASGCSFTKEKVITTVCNGVDADFSYTSTNGLYCGSTDIIFTNTTPGANAGTTRWFNQNGNFHTGISVSKTINPGYHKIQMVYMAAGGCIDTVTKYITVCNLSAYFTPTGVCLPDSFHFNPIVIDPVGHGCDSIVSYVWSSNGNVFSTQRQPVQYFPLGQRPVTLTITNTYGCTASLTQNTGVKSEFYKDIQIDTTLCPGAPLCITNNSTSPATLTETWSFPDGIPSSFTGHSPPCITYNTEGDKKIYYQALAGTCSRYDSMRVSVYEPELCGYLSADYFDCPNPPVNVCVTNCSQYLDPTTDLIAWDFGNMQSLEYEPCNFYTYPGCYPVTLSVLTNNGCTDTVVIDTVCIGGPYVSSYTVTPTTICACRDTVHFIIATVGATQLTFVSGCNQGFQIINPITPVGTEANPTILTFDIPYCVTDSCQPQITLGNATGCQTFINLPWIYIDTPVVDIAFDNFGLCQTGTICFSDASQYTLPGTSYTTSWKWDFGDPSDPTMSTAEIPCHYYSQPGSFPVTLTITSNGGCRDSTTRYVDVNAFPEANFSYLRGDTCGAASICFTDLTTLIGNATISTWEWCWGYGFCDTLTNPNPCHAYPDEDIYPVTLTVTDNMGCFDDTTITIIIPSVHQLEAIIELVSAVDSCTATKYCTTDASTGESPIVSRVWNLNSVILNATGACFTVNAPDTYPVTLTVTDNAGCTVTTDTVYTSNGVDIQADFVAVVFANTAAFTNASTGPFTQIHWDFGDGVSSSNNNPVHAYQNSGTYPVILTISDAGGCVRVQTKTVTIVISDVSSISKVAYNLQVTPNPFSDYTTLTLTGQTGNFDMVVTNAIGEIAATKAITTNQPLQLERNQLAAGLYIYTITNSKGIIARGKLLVE